MIRKGIDDGTLREDLDPRIVFVTLMGAINWIPRWYNTDGDLSPAGVAEMMTDVLIDGLIRQ